jgi:hypothetical protein
MSDNPQRTPRETLRLILSTGIGLSVYGFVYTTYDITQEELSVLLFAGFALSVASYYTIRGVENVL